jgi:hypothetical protein
MVIGHLDGMIAGIHNMRQVMINLKAWLLLLTIWYPLWLPWWHDCWLSPGSPPQWGRHHL